MADGKNTVLVTSADELWRVSTRRKFLKALGVGGSIVFLPSLFEACDSGYVPATAPGTGASGSVSLNLSNDTGILNYAYALEQLEAAFYTAVVASAAFSGMTAEQKEVMTDLRNHEVIHREFLKAALGSAAIPALALNQSTVTASLASTATILKNAEAFEDLGVSAYNGAGKYFTDVNNLLYAGKIVSVEARHAAAIRDMRDALGITGGETAGTRFAGDTVVSSTSGLDVKAEPSTVLGRVGATGFVSTSISIGTAPTKASTADAPPPATP